MALLFVYDFLPDLLNSQIAYGSCSGAARLSLKGTYHCPSELLCAAFEFLHALWEGQQEMAVSVLRKKYVQPVLHGLILSYSL